MFYDLSEKLSIEPISGSEATDVNNNKNVKHAF